MLPMNKHCFRVQQTDIACLHLQGALLMCFLQKPLYLSSLTVLLNLPPSAVCQVRQTASQQTTPQETATQPCAHQQDDPQHQHGDNTDLRAVQTAVQGAVSGG